MDAHDSTTSTRPYLLRALHEWCSDNGLTPYLVVQADHTVQVPQAFVQDGQIVLNTSYDATSGLHMGNDYISFKARFGGKPHEIMLPVGRVLAIYARETGQGMSFPPEEFEHPPEAMDDAISAAQPTAADAAGSKAKVVHLVSADKDAPPRSSDEEGSDAGDDGGDNPPPTPAGKRPALKLVK